MARLIVKSPYIKGGGGGPGGYLKYIGTREGVELLPADYMEYMAERPRSHGLFGDEDNVDMGAAMKELNEYPGNIWTHIISLKREDAERLGYDHAAQWCNLIRARRNELAAAMNIPPGDFRWYAAFHDEGGHPHIHMMAWSVKPGLAYLSKDGIRKIKSTLTNDIFKQEMLHTYEQKSSSRDELVRRAREEMKVLAQEMQASLSSHPEVESLMMTLVAQLESVTSNKKYGYLPKAVKKTVDEIVDLMERLPVINECYQVWWELQCQVEDFYSEKERQRPPLFQQKEFRSIKNAVIHEAENIRMGKVTFEDEEMEDAADSSELSYDCRELWMSTQDDTAPMADRDDAAAQLMDIAENGDPDAQYLVGRLYRDGPVLIPDSVKTQYWFDQSARRGHVPAQYELGKLLFSDNPEVHDTELGIQWLEYATHHGSDCAAYQLGKEYLRGKVVERDTAKAMEYFTQSAEAGNQFAQYVLGKLYLDRQDCEQAHYWFSQSATQGNEYAQFFLDRWDNLKPPSVMLSVSRLLHHMSRIFQEQMPLPTVPGGIQIDRKRLVQLREKKIAMGHKADDHEEQAPSQTMSMG
ncbi:MobP3 family relaxase [Oscillibacter sp.]|uniref:MobP3 family relaxase n=1 Tax=Oscillibacter sp. TaxID=1945593 RepID=UPI00216EB77B|nr:MobP3 family relaxase [Oscillibacter sp.]MCI9649840.1 sel1 repeat family protein [Oscillibacter sp.]